MSGGGCPDKYSSAVMCRFWLQYSRGLTHYMLYIKYTVYGRSSFPAALARTAWPTQTKRHLKYSDFWFWSL